MQDVRQELGSSISKEHSAAFEDVLEPQTPSTDDGPIQEDLPSRRESLSFQARLRDSAARAASTSSLALSAVGSEWPRHSTRSPQNRLLRNAPIELQRSSSFTSSTPRVLRQSCGTPSSRSRSWPLADENEALLLRHFVTKLSLWVTFPLLFML